MVEECQIFGTFSYARGVCIAAYELSHYIREIRCGTGSPAADGEDIRKEKKIHQGKNKNKGE